jgi:hypothetical protein
MVQITKEHLNKLREHQQKNYYGSQAQAMFVDGVFNSDNWNGGDGIIRQYFYDNVWMETKVSDIDFTYDSIHYWGDIIITHTWYDDQSYVTITFAGSYEKDGNLQLNDYEFEHVAFLTWYKSRGRTESVKFDGKPMTEEQYLFVLNALQETGFNFNLQ